jgi:hypothetical protein
MTKHASIAPNNLFLSHTHTLFLSLALSPSLPPSIHPSIPPPLRRRTQVLLLIHSAIGTTGEVCVCSCVFLCVCRPCLRVFYVKNIFHDQEGAHHERTRIRSLHELGERLSDAQRSIFLSQPPVRSLPPLPSISSLFLFLYLSLYARSLPTHTHTNTHTHTHTMPGPIMSSHRPRCGFYSRRQI